MASWLYDLTGSRALTYKYVCVSPLLSCSHGGMFPAGHRLPIRREWAIQISLLPRHNDMLCFFCLLVAAFLFSSCLFAFWSSHGAYCLWFAYLSVLLYRKFNLLVFHFYRDMRRELCCWQRLHHFNKWHGWSLLHGMYLRLEMLN